MDMWKSYLRSSWKNIRQHKFYSTINIFGLALGLACCLVILLFVREETSFDRFHANADNIYRIHAEIISPGSVMSTLRIASWIGPGLKEDLPEVEDTARLSRRDFPSGRVSRPGG